jgi:hypothetical protein
VIAGPAGATSDDMDLKTVGFRWVILTQRKR